MWIAVIMLLIKKINLLLNVKIFNSNVVVMVIGVNTCV